MTNEEIIKEWLKDNKQNDYSTFYSLSEIILDGTYNFEDLLKRLNKE